MNEKPPARPRIPRFVLTALGLSVVHLVAALGAAWFTLGKGMERFDDPAPSPSSGWVEQIADGMAAVLLQPGMSVWKFFPGSALPDAVEWLVFGANSLLWGAGLTIVVYAIRRWPKS